VCLLFLSPIVLAEVEFGNVRGEANGPIHMLRSIVWVPEEDVRAPQSVEQSCVVRRRLQQVDNRTCDYYVDTGTFV
jgi:hypothetical protein